MGDGCGSHFLHGNCLMRDQYSILRQCRLVYPFSWGWRDLFHWQRRFIRIQGLDVSVSSGSSYMSPFQLLGSHSVPFKLSVCNSWELPGRREFKLHLATDKIQSFYSIFFFFWEISALRLQEIRVSSRVPREALGHLCSAWTRDSNSWAHHFLSTLFQPH